MSEPTVINEITLADTIEIVIGDTMDDETTVRDVADACGIAVLDMIEEERAETAFSAWQDISTAPLKVLVLVAQSGKNLPIMAKKYARGWAFFGAPKQDVYWLTLDETPTHWQLLPLPLTSGP